MNDKLVERLRKQEHEAELQMVEKSSLEVTETTKEYADKKLLSLTGKALRTVEEVMD